jgi:hypothetical protein
MHIFMFRTQAGVSLSSAHNGPETILSVPARGIESDDLQGI